MMISTSLSKITEEHGFSSMGEDDDLKAARPVWMRGEIGSGSARSRSPFFWLDAVLHMLFLISRRRITVIISGRIRGSDYYCLDFAATCKSLCGDLLRRTGPRYEYRTGSISRSLRRICLPKKIDRAAQPIKCQVLCMTLFTLLEISDDAELSLVQVQGEQPYSLLF